METTRIQLLEKFGICTQVAKYYGYACQAYLLIARLNKRSRDMIYNNYEGMIYSLRLHTPTISISEKNKDMLLLQ